MKQSICLIDDRLPLNDDKVKAFFKEPNRKIHSSEINLLLDIVPVENWEEKELNLLLSSLRQDGNYKLAAFSNPAFFFNHNQYEEEYRPRIIVLDWDFGDTTPTEEYLQELLEFSFSLICIFTGKDNKHHLEGLIDSDKFKKFQRRVFLFHKDEENAVEKLKNIIIENEKTNFSFSFGQKLRDSSLKATDKILVDLGKISVNQLGNYLKILEGNSRDFIDFITERFRTSISLDDFTSLEKLQLSEEDTVDPEIAQAIWAYRLYNSPPKSDNRVTRGDIIELNDNYCFVITADCDLARFWHKNNGLLNIIPLHKIEKGNKRLKNRFSLTKASSELKLKHNSITSTPEGLAEGSFILPFIPTSTNNQLNLFGFAKEVKAINITIPNDLDSWRKKQDAYLKYEHLPKVTKRLATLSEPFLTPIIQHFLNSIAGYGVPDYPDSISKLIIEKAKEVLS